MLPLGLGISLIIVSLPPKQEQIAESTQYSCSTSADLLLLLLHAEGGVDSPGSYTGNMA